MTNQPTPPSSDHYTNLGVGRLASTEEVKKRFRLVAKEAHPDLGGDAERFASLKESYDILSDVQCRSQYDAQLLSEAKQEVSAMPEQRGFGTQAAESPNIQVVRAQVKREDATGEPSWRQSPAEVTEESADGEVMGKVAKIVAVVLIVVAVIGGLISLLRIPLPHP